MRLFFFALVVTGCATAKGPPPLQYEQSLATIHEAEALGASTVPAARAQLQLANDELAAARKTEPLAWARAARLLARAHADAELALALAQEGAARRDVKRATAHVTDLRAWR